MRKDRRTVRHGEDNIRLFPILQRSLKNCTNAATSITCQTCFGDVILARLAVHGIVRVINLAGRLLPRDCRSGNDGE